MLHVRVGKRSCNFQINQKYFSFLAFRTDDVIRLSFIPFSLEYLAKKWLYSLAVDSVTMWDDFVKVFLKKFYPIHKTAD